MKKKFIIVLIILITLIIFIKWDRNYDIKYKINNVSVEEKYNKDFNKLFIKINKNKKEYEFVIDKTKNKKAVEKINFFTNNKIECLKIIVKDQNINPICYQNKKLVSINLINNKKIKEHYKIKNTEEKLVEKNSGIKIYNNLDFKYFIWDYKNLIYLSNKERKKINITNQDVYDIKLTTKIDEYLVMADYTTKYDFNNFIIINTKSLKKDIWEFDYEISKDSYFLGNYDKSIYLVDKKNKVEYEIVPYKKKMRIVGNSKKNGIIYNKEFKNISLTKLVNEEQKFTKDTVYNFKVINNKLYLTYYKSDNKILIDDSSNIKIIDIIDDTVFYLIDDKLYLFNNKKSKVLLMQKFEWNFNSNNIIFVFK